jgi:hypothetical protein
MLGQVVQKPAPNLVGDIYGERPPYASVKGHENGNANEPVAIKYSVPYRADFGFGQIKLRDE